MIIRLIRNLVKRTRRAFLWNRALDAYNSDRATEAIALVHKMNKIAPLNHYQLAFLGTAYILSRDTLKARRFLEEAKAATTDHNHPSAQYVNAYAMAYLGMMDKDAHVGDLIRKALAVKCRRSLKRWLPLQEWKAGSITNL